MLERDILHVLSVCSSAIGGVIIILLTVNMIGVAAWLAIGSVICAM